VSQFAGVCEGSRLAALVGTAEGGCLHMRISHITRWPPHNNAAQIASAIIEIAPVVLFHICAEVVELADTPS
jgi:hypothetical protein